MDIEGTADGAFVGRLVTAARIIGDGNGAADSDGLDVVVGAWLGAADGVTTLTDAI